MSLEQTLERIAVALESIATQGASLGQMASAAAGIETATEAKATRKTKAKDEPAATPAPAPAAEQAKPVETPAPAPAPAEQKAEVKEEAKADGPAWADVLAKITELNKIATLEADGKTPKGRTGVLNTLKHFGCEGKKVPALAEIKKNAEVLAFVEAQIAEANKVEASGADDLGI